MSRLSRFSGITAWLVVGALLLPSASSQAADTWNGVWLLTSANADFTSTHGDVTDSNTGTLRSACHIVSVDENTLQTDCFQGAVLTVSGNILTSKDGGWRLVKEQSDRLSGVIKLTSQSMDNHDRASATMDVVLKKIAPIDGVLGTVSLHMDGRTEQAPIKGFVFSSMKTVSSLEGNNVTNNLLLILPAGQVSLVNTLVGVDFIQAAVGSLVVSDMATSKITIDAKNASLKSSFAGRHQGGSLFTGEVLLSY